MHFDAQIVNEERQLTRLYSVWREEVWFHQNKLIKHMNGPSYQEIDFTYTGIKNCTKTYESNHNITHEICCLKKQRR